MFRVDINPAPALVDIETEHSPDPTSYGNVAYRVNIDAATNAPFVGYTGGLTKDLPTMINFDRAASRPTMIGLMQDGGTIDCDTYQENITSYFNKILFEITAHLVRKNYVGEGAYHTAETRLMALRQQTTINGRNEILPVAVHYEAFNAIINEMSLDQPLPVLANIFFQSLITPLRDHMLSNFRYTVPTDRKSVV